jgi:site-specific recombinase XerD
VLALCIRDVSFEERRLRVHGKGGNDRLLPLPDLAVLSLGDYLRFERPARCKAQSVFVVLQGRLRGCPMTSAGLRSLFRQRRQKPDLAMANPHRFRHTFGADMARAGVRLPFLQRLMGHASAQTTLGYIQLSMSDLADEYRRAVRELEKRYPTASP